MKKILLLIIAIFSFALVGCGETATTDNSIANLELRIADIESQLDELQITIEHITVTEGLNGQVDYYVNKVNELSVVLLELKTEKDYMDKSKLPEYLFDTEGEFVDEIELKELLGAKYFGYPVHQEDTATIGFQFKFRYVINDSEIDLDDFLAKAVLLTNELSNYSYYIIGSSEIYLEFIINNNTYYLKYLVQTLLEDSLVMCPEIVIEEWLFTSCYGFNADLESVNTYYDSYLLNETFTGYVLDYN